MHATIISKKNEGITDEAEEHIFHQLRNKMLSKDWFLLGNQCTMHQFGNHKYLTNIHMVEEPVMVYCNAGSSRINQRVMFGKLSVLYHPDEITNVISPK